MSPWLWRPEAPPGASPVGSKSSSKCLPPAGSTWNLTVPGALAPGGSGRRSSQREGYNERMKNVTFMVGKWEKSICITYQKLKMNISFGCVFVYSICFEYVFDMFVRCVEDMFFFSRVCFLTCTVCV